MIKIGDRIDDRYRIESRVATGGMADVYEANDLIGKRIVCIKVMRADLLDNPKHIEMFKNETAAAASLNHPNIVKVYGRGMVDGRPYMATEYVKGQTLRDKLGFNGPLQYSDACEVMVQLTKGIEYIHQHGIIHRDIKPDNLFYLADGSVKITDFGIATTGDANAVQGEGDSIQGTIYYCAPEVLLGQPAKATSDVYALGIVFFEILTGRVPFEGTDPEDVACKHIKKHLPEPSHIRPGIPKSLEKIVIKACRKDPKERYQSAAEMNEDIVKAMSDKETFVERKSIFSRLFGFK